MRYKVRLSGLSPIIMHDGAAGLDTRSPANLEKAEINRKKGSNRTESDDARLRELECQTSLWLNPDRTPTIPPAALRAVIENGARKVKQGAQVREGLVVEFVETFDYDRSRYGQSLEELCQKCQFTVGVVVQRSRVNRTRAKFELPWSVTFVVDCDDEVVDRGQLANWLEIAGRRVGVGDWRPQKSGHYGRFKLESIDELD